MTDTDLKYLMGNILTDAHCLLPNAVMPLKIDGLNFDSLTGKHQKRHNFPPVKILRYAVYQSDPSLPYYKILIYICIYVRMCVCMYVCMHVCM